MGALLCDPVLRPFVGDLFDRLSSAQFEQWQERAAIVEFEADLARPLAEALALIELLRMSPEILSGVVVLEVEVEGSTQWLLTNILTHARAVVADMSGREVAFHSVSQVVAQQYDGIAVLSTPG